MRKRAAFAAARFGFLLPLILVLSACVARGPFIAPSMAEGARTSVELDATPFFPQDRYQCGPAALAMTLGASDVTTTPEELVPLVYLPARKGSLQVEMQATPRKFERLSYVLSPNFDSIVAELNAGRPVLVLHNYGLPAWPKWHYAVVIGYDSARDRFILRSGTKRRDEWRARTFMVAWHHAHRWAMVVLRPGEIPVNADPRLYLQAAADFERGARPEAALRAFDAAVKRWPAEPVAWIGRGTAQYRAGRLTEASQDYAAAVRIDANHAGARNNYAQALLELGCPRRAREQLSAIDGSSLQSPLREAVSDTRVQVDAAVAQTTADSPECTIPVGGY